MKLVDSQIFQNFDVQAVAVEIKERESEASQIASYLLYIVLGVFALVFIPVACLVLFDECV